MYEFMQIPGGWRVCWHGFGAGAEEVTPTQTSANGKAGPKDITPVNGPAATEGFVPSPRRVPAASPRTFGGSAGSRVLLWGMLALTGLGFATRAGAQGVDQFEWIRRIMDDADRIYKNGMEGLDNLLPRLKQNPVRPQFQPTKAHAKLVAVFRAGRITRIQEFTRNGMPVERDQVELLLLRTDGSLWEFYEDGTFILKWVGNDQVGFPKVRGTYTRDRNRFAFRAEDASIAPTTLIEFDISGILAAAPDGSATADVSTSRFCNIQWKVNNMPGRVTSRHRQRYTVPLMREGQSAAVQPTEVVKHMPPAITSKGTMPKADPHSLTGSVDAPSILSTPPPAVNLAGTWVNRFTLPDGRQVTEMLTFFMDGRFAFSAVASDGQQTPVLLGRHEVKGRTITLVNASGQTLLQASLQGGDDRGFVLRLPNGASSHWVRFP